MAGAVYIPMAKLMDVWGRAEGFLLMVAFSVLGLILTASSKNLATYCAAQVFYTVGYSGLIYAVEILAIDASDLRNRALAFAFTSSPYMITAFAGPAAAEAFLLNVSWEWGFGAFCIIMPFVTLPVYVLLKYNLRKAKKMGLLKERVRSGRTVVENIVHWFHEFDGEFWRLLYYFDAGRNDLVANQANLAQSSASFSSQPASSSSCSPSPSQRSHQKAGPRRTSSP